MEVMRISPAEVVKLALPPKDLYQLWDKPNPDAARSGIKKHEELLMQAQLREGLTLPGFAAYKPLIAAENSIQLFPEETFCTTIGEAVIASTQMDILIGDALCGEIKPYIKGRHILQLMLTTLIWADNPKKDSVDSMLYFYSQNQQPKILKLEDGGAQVWDQGRNLLSWAAEIYATQKMLDLQKKLKKKQKQTGKQGEWLFGRESLWEDVHPQRAVELRREFDASIKSLMKPLEKLLRNPEREERPIV